MGLKTVIRISVLSFIALFAACSPSRYSPNMANTEVNAIVASTSETFYSFGHLYNKEGGANHTVATVASYDAHGLDLTFANQGKATVSPAAFDSSFQAGVMDSQGNIIAAGLSYLSTTDAQMLLVRFTSLGQLDSTFGTGGIVLTNPSVDIDVVFGVAVQSDGKILTAGASFGYRNWIIRRYNMDGSIDTEFGTAGAVTKHTGIGNNYTAIKSISVLPSGKILVAGTLISGTGMAVSIAQYLEDGSPDLNFGTKGFVRISRDSDETVDFYPLLAIQNDGRIVVGMTPDFNFADPTVSQAYFYLTRLYADGKTDTSFGTNGVTTKRFSPDAVGVSDVLFSIVLQTDGKIVAGGTASYGNVGHPVLARFDVNGALDLEFGISGATEIEAMPGALLELGKALAIQPETGKILLGGSFLTDLTTGNWLTYRIWP